MVTVLPTDGKQSSPLGLAFLTQVHVVTLSGCGCHCSTNFYDGFDAVLARRRRNNGSFRTVLSSELVASFFHATHFFASQCSSVIDRLPETVKFCLAAHCLLGMGLRSGLTACFKEEFEAFVFLDGFLEAVSSVYTRVLAGHFCPT